MRGEVIPESRESATKPATPFLLCVPFEKIDPAQSAYIPIQRLDLVGAGYSLSVARKPGPGRFGRRMPHAPTQIPRPPRLQTYPGNRLGIREPTGP